MVLLLSTCFFLPVSLSSPCRPVPIWAALVWSFLVSHAEQTCYENHKDTISLLSARVPTMVQATGWQYPPKLQYKKKFWKDSASNFLFCNRSTGFFYWTSVPGRMTKSVPKERRFEQHTYTMAENSFVLIIQSSLFLRHNSKYIF